VTAAPIPFVDLAAQRARLGGAIEAAMLRVVAHGAYIMGPEVARLEAELSAFCGAPDVVTCANGTDALAMVLMAKGVGPGDAVFCPSFTFAATAEAVAWVGATPVFVDVEEESFNLDPASLKRGTDTARRLGLKPAGVIPVDLFGRPADYEAIERISAREGLWVLCDAAQSFGAADRGRKVGAIGDATATSFFPAKPLGCYGDGGAILTADAELAATLRSIRSHGQGSDKYENIRVGLNSRLDTVQAAVLIEKLKIFPDEIAARNRIAHRYSDLLLDAAVVVPQVPHGSICVWAQYTLRLPGQDRCAVQAALRRAGIPTAVYYPKPLHRQPAYRAFPVAGNGLPVSERLSREVLSLPMHPYLAEEVQDRIVSALRNALRSTEPARIAS
jgi:dTDP-4-amino-4,6-dideoxygalactose transaminase